METQLKNRPSWRDYQARLNRKNDLRHLLFRLRWVFVIVSGLMVIAFGVKTQQKEKSVDTGDVIETEQSRSSDDYSDVPEIQKSDIRAWLPPESVVNLEAKQFDIQVNQAHYRIDTSLDLSLQTNLLKKVRSSNAELMGLVVLDPDDGKVLAMVSVDNDNSSTNPCLDNSFPAASIFKIVTASAAIEQCKFSSQTMLTFNGGKYTLYKSQLKNSVNRYTTSISFQDAFAQSVNPVFGKIGAQNLGRESLEKYGRAFGFNRDIDFEIALPQSMLEVTDESYHLAEIACGFNRSTTLTPLHGALIVAAVLNGGRLPAPTLIEQIVDDSDRELYRSTPAAAGEAISSRAATVLESLMTRTVSSGTSQKTFRGAAKDRVLSKLVIGGKTGSIDNKEHSRRMDWFIGFAGEKNGTEKIVIAVVVGHGKYIGMRAAEFAKYTFQEYFKEYFAAVAAKQHPEG